MSPAQLTVESLPAFIDRVSEIEERWIPKEEPLGLWYRGHQKAYWKLLPRLYRDLSPRDNAREADDEIREDFIKRAPSLTDRKPENPWEWYFLMQHYRAPTRLLDWTEGALIGLYFAVTGNQGHHDAAVWMLDPWWLNKKVVRKYEVIPPGAPGASERDRLRYRPWLPDQFDGKSLRRRLPVAVYPNHIDRRIVAQQSCFTIHGNSRQSLDELFAGEKDRLAKIILPSYAVAKIKQQLEIAGINEATVFPDLEGLGRRVSEDWQSNRDASPHQGVYTRLGPSEADRGGVGVFAIRKIPKGTPLFVGDSDEMVWLDGKSLPKAPWARKLYEFAVIKDGRYGCPVTFDRLTMSWYLNHSTRPNVKCTHDYDFISLEAIPAGKELTVDYSTYNDPPALEFEQSPSGRGPFVDSKTGGAQKSKRVSHRDHANTATRRGLHGKAHRN
ncbi:MAG: FRG domain-containing protein [Candidatus Acidiferrales bacterium]